MCQRIQCPVCNKPSYAGCGRHIEQVLADVPAAERCHCSDPAQAKPKNDSSWLGRLFGR
jgi:hypothetical protein